MFRIRRNPTGGSALEIAYDGKIGKFEIISRFTIYTLDGVSGHLSFGGYIRPSALRHLWDEDEFNYWDVEFNLLTATWWTRISKD